MQESLPMLSPDGSGILSKFRTTATHRLMTTILTNSIPVPFLFNPKMNRQRKSKIAPPLPTTSRWWGTRHAKRRNRTNAEKKRTPQNSMFYWVLRINAHTFGMTKYRRRGSNPHMELPIPDFESGASAIPPLRRVGGIVCGLTAGGGD